MRQNVHDFTEGIADKEPAHTPWLIRQWVDDGIACLFSSAIYVLKIVDLDREVWHFGTGTPWLAKLSCGSIVACVESVLIQP